MVENAADESEPLGEADQPGSTADGRVGPAGLGCAARNLDHQRRSVDGRYGDSHGGAGGVLASVR